MSTASRSLKRRCQTDLVFDIVPDETVPDDTLIVISLARGATRFKRPRLALANATQNSLPLFGVSIV